jgi:putative CocE/NonD family hydrolase
VVEPELDATMRDGTVLRADVYRPRGDGPWPVLLARTPYGKRDEGVLGRLEPLRAVERGFLVVIQDCRGRMRSEGRWEPLVHERADGYDTVRWAARLPGSDGRVCMYGPSYLGYAQWAAASARPPELCAVVPAFTWSSPDDGLISRGGADELGLVTQWTLSLAQNVLERRHADDPVAADNELAILESALSNLTTRTYWELPPYASLRRLNLVTPTDGGIEHGAEGVAAFVVAGWYDCFLQGSLDTYVRARSSGVAAALVVGPWTHDDQSGRIGEVDFGAAADAARIDGGKPLLERQLDWLDRQLAQEAAVQQQPVLLFVMGVNRWRSLATWPPESVEVPWYLHEGGGLCPEPPASSCPPDVFIHDPNDPVPTLGGALLLPPDYPAGPVDQRNVETRDDVLVYTSAPLRAPLEVIGRVRLHVEADSTATCADWVARLCDVDTEGVSRNLADGIVRITQPQPGEIIVDLWSTAHVFLPGHRIRVQIASSSFPRWDRNVCGPIAHQSIYHDTARPSRIVLPVVAAADQPPMLRSSM